MDDNLSGKEGAPRRTIHLVVAWRGPLVQAVRLLLYLLLLLERVYHLLNSHPTTYHWRQAKVVDLNSQLFSPGSVSSILWRNQYAVLRECSISVTSAHLSSVHLS